MRRKNDTPIVIMNASKQPIISIGAKFGKVWIMEAIRLLSGF